MNGTQLSIVRPPNPPACPKLEGVFLGLVVGILVGASLYFFGHDFVDLSSLMETKKALPTIVLDDVGDELVRFEQEKRIYVSYQAIPHRVIQAFLAAEDHSFFDHAGISVRGIIRSAITNVVQGRVVQGGSTITQQVARLLFLTHKRTWWRKIQEIGIALQLERSLSKEHILELYLNHIYFGQGIYGIEAACQRFWKTSVSSISLQQAATLAAVAKSARLFSPLNAPLTAKKRRNVILRAMYQHRYITQGEYEMNREQPMAIRDIPGGDSIRLYVHEWLRNWLEQRWGRDAVYHQGLIVKTTINQRMQDQAQAAFLRSMQSLHAQKLTGINGGMITIEVHTGKIKNFIGGSSFQVSQFNRAFQAYRQLGSSFKPILYALALARGFDMDSVLIDEPLELVLGQGQVWRPQNWNHTFEGPMTLARALTFSNNSIAISLLLKLGINNVIAIARQFGITKNVTPYPSLALGTAHASVQECAAAFNVFAHGGSYVEPYLVEWVKDRAGKKIWEHAPIERVVLDKVTNAKMIKALAHRMDRTREASKAGWIDSESIGKTGSTNEATSVWFVGSTPEHTTAIYLGRDDNKPLGNNVYARKTAFPLWLDFHQKISCNQKQFYLDPRLHEKTIDGRTGQPIDGLLSSEAITILK